MRSFKDFLKEASALNMFRDLEKPTQTTRLFHKDVGLPQNFPKPAPGMRLTYGTHAKQAIQDERIAVDLPVVVPANYTIIEVEMQKKQVLKWVVRVPTNTVRDLVMVITPDGFVKTVWTNDKNDKHSTLKRHLYSRPN